MAEPWLRNEVITGLQKLVLLRLPGTPAADSIPGTAQAWLEALDSAPVRWNCDLDAARIRDAFATLLLTCDAWPVPRRLLEVMAGRAHQASLPKPPMSEERRRAGRGQLRRISEMLGKNDRLQQEKDV